MLDMYKTIRLFTHIVLNCLHVKLDYTIRIVVTLY